MTLRDFERQKDVLVALLKDQRDEDFITFSKWYRIPVSTKLVPLMVRNGTIKYIAFYLPRKFGDLYWSIPWFGEVSDIKKVKRRELFYEEGSIKNDIEYYKIEIKKLEELDNPIYARRGRRFLFLTTTEQKFKEAEEINDLFYESPLEEKLWEEFKKYNIQAERQWEVKIKNNYFYLDFALMCKATNIDVECDGYEYHRDKEKINQDKKRNNLLTSNKWEILRFDADAIYNNIDETINQIMETVNNYGGIEEINIKNYKKRHRYLNKYGRQEELF